MKKSVLSSSKLVNPYGEYYSLATRAGDLVFLSLQLPVNVETGKMVTSYDDLEDADLERVRELSTGLLTSDSREGPAMAQVWQCYSQTAVFLEELGSSIDNILFTMLFLTDMRDYPTFTRSRRAYFAPEVPPASTSAMIKALPHPKMVFGFDAYAFIPDMNRPEIRVVHINESRHVKHLKLSDYGLATKVGPYLFVSGVVPAQPEKGVFVKKLDDLGAVGEGLSTGSMYSDSFEGAITAQTHIIYEILKGILEENGSSFDHVLKSVIYLTDMRSLPSVERVSRMMFPRNKPATSICGTFQQAHKDFLMEIELIAVMPDVPECPKKESFDSERLSPKTGYNAGITKAGQLLFTSGIMPVDPKTGRTISGPEDISKLGKGVTPGSMVLEALEGNISSQAWYVHYVLQEALKAHGSSMRDVLKVNLYLNDMKDFPLVARIAKEFFGDSPPAITPIQAASLPHRGVLLQMDAIALAQKD